MCRLGAVQGLRTRRGAALLLIGGCLVLAAGCGGDDADEADGGTTQSTTASQETVDADLSAVQTFLGDHTEQLTGFTHEFNEHAAHYARWQRRRTATSRRSGPRSRTRWARSSRT